ncbi:winged helix-turn-helix domain-containing protein [Parabacteroides goldsteinii]|uniref:helix-turn-helix domain-containing protein n=1 Tax=Parabacteroides goldsteinii TaxID=328812 RepID=UPI001CCADF80|nr:winged helix-turn-helix domain-containing protein [Parabacteroides goldsteinii]UBD76380.1 winged helix-turn-helix domain-containing protein [Parabacteroides goldsteinii]
MNTRLAANLSVLFTACMLVLSFSFGFHNYSEAQKAIVSDLNQALQQTIMQNSELWMNQDTLKTYSRLSAVFGNPVSIESYNKDFAEALKLEQLKDKSGIIVHVKNKKAIDKPVTDATPGKDQTKNYLASDTIIWLSANLNLPESSQEDLGISFQGYVNYSASDVLALTDKKAPLLLLLLALMAGCLSWFLMRRKQAETPVQKENLIAFGNLTFSCDKACFYKEDQEKLRLTPQQYKIMEMFYLTSSHILARTDICEALWPGKENADETLNTLIRRLRPLIEENSNLKITTDRGRAYQLEIKEPVTETYTQTA